MNTYESWGRFPKVDNFDVVKILWERDALDISSLKEPVLPYAYGRSYGDSCLNEGGTLLDVTGLDRFISFDDETGVLRCEAGVRFDQILDTFVPRGWFLPVSPGTKFVSVGGAIANDIHGKNHHFGGTFGCHVLRFELVRSSGERLICSPDENQALYHATIGGLGLTGLITWAEIQLKPIRNAFIDVERIRFDSLDRFMELAIESAESYEYTVAWVDCFVGGGRYVRGYFMRGNHDASLYGSRSASTRRLPLAAPIDLPSSVLNTFSVRAFNSVYYALQRGDFVRTLTHLDPFFYPLDAIHDWNRIYGKRGFLQYQCVVPIEDDNRPIKQILDIIRTSRQGSFLTVFKTFGHRESPGMLSFPRPGLTLALDFVVRGPSTFELLDNLDHVVRDCGGAVYPAKDARMSSESFKAFYPQWRDFVECVDPMFSSSFSRRVLQL